MAMVGEPQMVFLVGRGRSGNTLLRKMLNKHTALAVAPESLFIRNTIRKFGKVTQWDESTIASFCTDIFRERRMQWWPFQKDELVSFFHRQKLPANFREACLTVYRCYAHYSGKEDARVIIDKNPHHALYIGKLQDLFPNSKVLHLVRDYRDNVLSYKNVGFDVNNTAALAYRWKKFNKAILDRVEDNDRYLLVRFESLVSDPGVALSLLCDFLEVEYDNGLLEFYLDNEKEERHWHQHTLQPVDASKAGQWKRQLDKRDQEITETICGAAGRFFGYEPTSEPTKVFRPMVVAGLFYGKLVTFAEMNIFFMPLNIRIILINLYRKMSGVK